MRSAWLTFAVLPTVLAFRSVPARAETCFDPALPGGDSCNERPTTCGSIDRNYLTVSGGGEATIVVVGEPTDGYSADSCRQVQVETTGYYSLFTKLLDDSCAEQHDETGWLTVSNGCNSEGFSVEHNAEGRYLVLDYDNHDACDAMTGCADRELTCRPVSDSMCCVPPGPVFLGTFLFVGGEDNELCLHHWCPVRSDELGFVLGDCAGPNSLHLDLSTTQTWLCPDTLRPCALGCGDTGCVPEPCETMICTGDEGPYCADGACTSDNPCNGNDCAYGCAFGRCLAPNDPYGDDLDSDGYSSFADCNDGRGDVHPGALEICESRVDEDCDGYVDEEDDCVMNMADAGMPDATPPADAAPPDAGSADAAMDADRDDADAAAEMRPFVEGRTLRGGGACGIAGGGRATPWAIAIAIGLLARTRRRRAAVGGGTPRPSARRGPISLRRTPASR